MARAARRASTGVRGILADRARDVLFDLSQSGPRLVELDLETIAPHPDQPRRQVDPAALDELASSIEQHGLLQPIVVKAEGEGYTLVAGQRRLLAHRRLGRERIAAIITTGRPDELALIENLQREALQPLDEAAGLAALKERYGYTQEQLASVLAKAKSTISELLSINDLAEPIKAAIRAGDRQASKSLLIEVARQGSDDDQIAFWRALTASERATVRQARASRAGAGHRTLRDAARPPRPAVNLVGAAKRLEETLADLEPEAVVRDRRLRATLERLQAELRRLLAP